MLNYHSNNRNNLPLVSETTDPLDSECLPNSEASQLSDLGHTDIDSAEESDYSATQSKRPKSSKSTLRATGRKTMQSYGAPVAPMMGATTSKRLTELKNANGTTRKVPQSPQYQREYATSSGNRQEKRRNRVVSSQTCDDATSDSPGHGQHIIFDSPASDPPSPSRTMNDLPERQRKRSANDNIHVANSKKTKLPDKVRPSNPRLIIILKLKREKITPHPEKSAEEATDRRPIGRSSSSQLLSPHEGSSVSPNNHDHSHFGPHGYYTPGPEASTSAKRSESEKNHAHQEHNPPSVPPAAFVVDAIDESHNYSVAEKPLQHQAPKEHGRDDLQKAASITPNTSGGNDAGAPEVDWLHVQKLRAQWFAAARAAGRRTRTLAPSEIPRDVASYKEMFPWAKSLSDKHTEQVVRQHVKDLTMARQRVTADQTSFGERGVQKPDANTVNGNIANATEAVSGIESTQYAQATGDMSVDKSRPEHADASVGKVVDSNSTMDSINEPNKVSPVLIDHMADPLTGVTLCLFLSEQSDVEAPDGWVSLTNTDTRESLFELMHKDLANELQADGVTIYAVTIKCADGQLIPGTKLRAIPIKKTGPSDMWKQLAVALSNHGAGEGGLLGYVKVRKVVDAK